MKRPLVVFLFLCFGWKFVKSEDASSVDCKLFKVRTEDTSESSGYKDNDTSKYTHELKGLLKNQPLYKFNTGTKFLALLYNDEFVWQHTSSHDPNKFPEELEIDPFNKTLWIKYGGMDFLTFKFENDKWKHSGDLSYGQCKGVTIPDYNATSVPGTPVTPPAEEKVDEEEAVKPEEAEEEPEKPEEEAEPEAEEKPAEEPTEVDSGEAEEKTEDAEPEKPDEGAPEAEEAHAEEPHVAPDEGEAAKPAEAGTDGDAPADQEAAPVPEGEDASPPAEVVPESAAPETHDDGDKAPDATPAAAPEVPEATPPAVPEVHEEDASKADGDATEASNEPGLESEEAEAVVDDLLPSNLYPDDLTGAFHFGLRGTLYDEDVEAKAEEKSEAGETVASDADAAKPADEGSTPAADSEDKTQETEKATEEHKDKEDKKKPTEEKDESAAPDAKPEAETGTTVDEDKKEDHVSAGQEEGAKPADATVAEPAEGDDSSKVPDSDAAPAPAAEVEDASKAADSSTTPDADKGDKKVAVLKLEHEGKLLKMFTQSDDDSAQEGSSEGKFNFELENKVLSAKFKDGVKCVKLEYEEKEVWKHDEAKHGTKHPTEVRFDTQSLEVVLTFDDKSKFTYKYDTKSNAHAFALSSVPLDVSERPADLKFFKDADGNDEIGNAELTLAKESDGTKEFVVHSFNSGVKCHVVKYQGKDVWEYDTDFNENYPASVHFNKDDRELRVFVRANWFYFYKFDTTKNEHDIYREKEPADVASE